MSGDGEKGPPKVEWDADEAAPEERTLRHESHYKGFDDDFALLTGNPPFPWQRTLYERFVASDFDVFATIVPTYDLGRLGCAFGYVGLVMLFCKSQILRVLKTALAAVGRMALSNYLAHSILCALIFNGVGLGLVGVLQRYQLYFVVVGIWLFQLVASPLWLRYYRFGPAEWLWRSLTYGARQPMRV